MLAARAAMTKPVRRASPDVGDRAGAASGD